MMKKESVLELTLDKQSTGTLTDYCTGALTTHNLACCKFNIWQPKLQKEGPVVDARPRLGPENRMERHYLVTSKLMSKAQPML